MFMFMLLPLSNEEIFYFLVNKAKETIINQEESIFLNYALEKKMGLLGVVVASKPTKNNKINGKWRL